MPRRTVVGLALALVSAATFGTSGSLAKGLLEAGWSPAAAVTWRVTVGVLVLAVPAGLAMRGRWHLLRRGWPSIALFGAVAVAACQLSFFLAVERLSVGVALLLEYLGLILVVGWLWLRHGERPRPLTVVGAGLAVAGLVLVLDVFGVVQIDPVGVLWGLCAAVGLAVYFVVSADERTGLPPLVVATGGLAVGAALLIVAGTLGLTSMQWSRTDVALAGSPVPWWLAVLALGLVAAAVAYATGVAATRRLGSKLASFVGLTEVLFAVLFAWLLLGELPAPVQLVGGLLILGGVVAVKSDERRPEQVAPAVLPDDDTTPSRSPVP
ncbi:MAG: DMT family transporter [Actinomycetota bacterium]|nr:DMT family transporter [Actinomycetota bacterium]